MQTSEQRKFLFITGVPRSGTTALANVVNEHERIGLCKERFKALMTADRISEYVPALFEKERLFDFSDGYTNLSPLISERSRKTYEAMQEKYETLTYLGNKEPSAWRFSDRIHQQFPGSKIVFIIRDIVEIACSWQTRADKETDTWPAAKTAEKAVTPWNRSNNMFLELKHQFPDDFYAVDYGSFFGGNSEDNSQLTQLMEFIDMDADEAITSAFENAKEHYALAVQPKERKLDPEILAYIEENADVIKYQKAIGLLPMNQSELSIAS